MKNIYQEPLSEIISIQSFGDTLKDFKLYSTEEALEQGAKRNSFTYEEEVEDHDKYSLWD